MDHADPLDTDHDPTVLNADGGVAGAPPTAGPIPPVTSRAVSCGNRMRAAARTPRIGPDRQAPLLPRDAALA